MLSTEVADIFTNLFKNDDAGGFSVSTLCQLFSSERITLDFATQQCQTIEAKTPFAILGGIQMKPTVFLTHTLAAQNSGQLDRMMICIPKCLPPSMQNASSASQVLNKKDYDTTFGLCMETIATAHPTPESDNDEIIYKFNEDARQHLFDMHLAFNASFCEAITHLIELEQ